MILEKGNMWDAFGKGTFIITTNPIIKKDGSVVMGRGIALEAKQRFPELPYLFGKRLINDGNQYLDYIAHFDHTPIWYFMVKNHWQEQANLGVIKRSADILYHWITEEGCKQHMDLNFPGIGNGRLEREQVFPLLEKLPDNVHIWEKE